VNPIHFLQPRRSLPHGRFAALLLLIPISWLAGCATPGYRLHPEFSTRTEPIRIFCLAPVDVSVFEELPDGRLVRQPAWSEEAREVLHRSVVDTLKARNFTVCRFSEGRGDVAVEVAEVLKLYQAVNKSIQLHTFGPNIFPAKQERFEYSVGDLRKMTESTGADAVIFARGLYRVSDRHPRIYISFGIADASGNILWYGADGSRKKVDFSDTGLTARLVRNVWDTFPGDSL
jgi:hypothetical protein